MDRALQYISGGVASTALIAGAIAAFISITALVGDTNFPNGSSVQPPGGPHSVRIAGPSQPPAGPIAVAAPRTQTASTLGAVHQLALVGRRRPTQPGGARRRDDGRAQRGHGTERLRYRRPPRGRAFAECRERSRGYAAWLTGRGRRHPLESSRRERIAAVRGNRPISPAVSGARAGRHSPAHVRWRHAGEHAAVRGNRPALNAPGPGDQARRAPSRPRQEARRHPARVGLEARRAPSRPRQEARRASARPGQKGLSQATSGHVGGGGRLTPPRRSLR